MKLERAIEYLVSLKAGCSGEDLDPEREALKLGIEALKLTKRLRDKSYNYRIPLLPGETP